MTTTTTVSEELVEMQQSTYLAVDAERRASGRVVAAVPSLEVRREVRGEEGWGKSASLGGFI